jgi:5-methylcytosine-specific restriction enzyme subunit McrC
MKPLTEWEKSPPITLLPAERRILERIFRARITSSDEEGRWIVTAGGRVGTITRGGSVIVVQPKIPIDRVLFMIAYANDPFGWDDEWSSLHDVDDLVDGLAALFAHAAERTLARGLHRSYRSIESDEPTIRGRIRWPVQARRAAPLPIGVRYQVHDDDTVENRILRAALVVLRQSPIRSARVRARVERLWRQVRHVTPVRDAEHLLRTVTYTRLNEGYRPLLGLAELILRDRMADVDTGGISASGFTVDMAEVFEDFVRVGLREAAGLSSHDFPDALGKRLHLGEGGAIPMTPDLGLLRDGQWAFVGDAKYKRDSGSGKDSDLYQLLAYAIATDLADATLIYAQGPPGPRTHVVRYLGRRLHLRHLDLSREPREVLAQLRRIAPGQRTGRPGRLGTPS